MAKDRKKSGKKANRKGKNYEREVAIWLSNIFGMEFRRSPNSGAYRQNFPGDIMKKGMKPTAIDGAVIECKNYNEITTFLDNWLRESNEEAIDAGTRDWVLIFHRPQTTEDYVIMPREYFGKLIQRLHGYEEEERQKEK